MYEDLSREDLIRHIAELNREIIALRQQRDEANWVEDSLKERTQILGERMKELRCSYEAIRLLRAPHHFEEKIDLMVRSIPAAWQYPKCARALIEINGRRYASPEFLETRWSQEEPIRSQGRQIGRIKVCYTKELPKADEGPFLREERALIQVLAECAGVLYETNQSLSNP